MGCSEDGVLKSPTKELIMNKRQILKVFTLFVTLSFSTSSALAAYPIEDHENNSPNKLAQDNLIINEKMGPKMSTKKTSETQKKIIDKQARREIMQERGEYFAR